MTRVEVRPLLEQEWDAAMALTTRAFLHEPFITALFGQDLITRYARARAMYSRDHRPADDASLVAVIAGEIVGAIGVEPPGHCHHCRPGDRDSLYAANAAAAHALAPAPHGWVGRVAVEPALHGSGIGSLLVAAALDELRARGAAHALLDAEEHRVSYYLPHGFVAVDSFTGSVSNVLVLMRADLQ